MLLQANSSMNRSLQVHASMLTRMLLGGSCSSKQHTACGAHTLLQVGGGEGQLHEHAVRGGDGEGEEVGERVHPVVVGGAPHGVNYLAAQQLTAAQTEPPCMLLAPPGRS